MRLWETSKSFFVAPAVLVVALAAAGCQQQATVETTNANSNTSNINTANSNAAANTNATNSTAGASVAAREPEKYTARIVFTGQAAGQTQKIEVPLDVARNGADRRYALTLPVGQLIFLDRADKRYIIMPSQKQYAELTPEVTGFDVRSLTPVQMVAQLEKMQGVEQIGEETINGRAALKYRAAARANTASQAGQVTTENFIYVDKETGLPLRWEGYGQSTGNVQGVNNLRIVAETKEIKTDVDPTLFEVPQDMRKLTAEEMKRYANMVAGLLSMVLNQVNAQQSGTTTNAPPASGTSAASPTATPAGH